MYLSKDIFLSLEGYKLLTTRVWGFAFIRNLFLSPILCIIGNKAYI